MTRRSLFALASILPFMRKPASDESLAIREKIAPELNTLMRNTGRGFMEKLAERVSAKAATTTASKEFSDAVSGFDEAVQRKSLPPELL